MNEIKILYVLEIKGEKHYYATEHARNYHRNIMTKNGTFPSKVYEISIEDLVES